MSLLGNLFSRRKRRSTHRAGSASPMVVSSQVKGFKAAVARNNTHARLLGFVAKSNPDDHARVSAKLAAAQEAAG